jgi:hypothetical protein
MPDAYTSQFSGEEIDAALRAAQIISGADTPAELRKKLEIRGDTIPVSATDPTPVSEALTASGGGVNPNLFDNWYFGRPVNQRGQTEYTSSGYTIDRWYAEQITVQVMGGYIKCTSSGTYTRLQQTIEGFYLAGNTITFSALAKSAPRKMCRIMLYDLSNDTEYELHFRHNFTSSDWELVTGTATIRDNVPEKLSILFYVDDSEEHGSLDILAAKLELGDTQTLAHEEGDKWVLNEIPDYGEQLRRCQRYFVRLTNAYGYGWTYNSSIANFFVSLPTTMRANPVIKLTTNGEIQTINGAKTVTGFEAKGIHPNGFAIDLHNSANALITGTPVTWHSSSMDISADL